MEKFGKFTVFFVLIVINMLARGFVIMKFWAWFIASTFSVNEIRMIEAIGLSMIASLFTVKINKKDSFDFKSDLIHMVAALFYYVIVLFIGYTISLFY